MVIDTSALVALINGEPEAPTIYDKISAAPTLVMSAATLLEFTIVLGHSRKELARSFVRDLGISVVPFNDAQLATAQDAFYRFGRNSGSPAKLNFGDCFSYAAAKTLEQPLLFKGQDFIHTDVEQA